MKKILYPVLRQRIALLPVTIVVVAAAVLLSCGGKSSSSTPTTTTPNFAKIVVLPTSATTTVGKQQPFAATAETSAGTPVTGVSFTWSSSKTDVATVASDGVATAIGPGTADISVKATTTAGTTVTSSVATLTVLPKIASVTISPTTATIAAGQTQQYTATALDANGNTISGVQFAWFSSYAAVAMIDATGLATGVSAGTVTIQASAGGVNSSPATLTVTP